MHGKMPVTKRIAFALKDGGGMSVADLAAAVGSAAGVVNARLKQMRRDGHAEEIGGLHRLTREGRHLAARSVGLQRMIDTAKAVATQ